MNLRAALLRIACAGLAASLALPGPAAAQKVAQGVPLPDGTWRGETYEAGGTIAQAGAFGATAAVVSFEVRVDEGEVTGGSMTMSGRAASEVPGGEADLEISGEFDLSGTADYILADGVVSFQGTVTAQGFTQPVNASAPGHLEFFASFASCSRATGDLAIVGRQLQEFAGVSTTVQGNFVAVRVREAEAQTVVDDYKALVEDIALAVAQVKQGEEPPSVEALFDLVTRVHELLRRIVRLKACGDTPPGFEQGLADPYVAIQFQILAEALLKSADQLETTQVLTILYLAQDVGALGPSSPDQAAAQQLLDSFLVALNNKIDQALGQGDEAALLEIYTAAQQLGLKDVATKAKSALDQLGGGG